MIVISINKDWKDRPGYFSLSILAPDEYYWKERSFSFFNENDQIYFLIGGQEKDKKIVGQGVDELMRIKKTIVFLEHWLKEKGAIGTLESRLHLQVIDVPSSSNISFGLQVWAWDEEIKARKDTIFNFSYEKGYIYYLGSDKESTREKVIFVYEDRKTKISKELIPFVNTKEEAIQNAIDYLEWKLSTKQIKGYKA